jgi:septal ring factor EnvC (AmiA/AmiB activator)
MMKTYLQILEDSLEKKLALLQQIEDKSEEQAQMLKATHFDMEALDKNMDEKAALIEQITALDAGFEDTYDRIRAELLPKKDQYKDEIASLQKLITKVTDKSASIQAIESRNKAETEIRFSQEKRELRTKRNVMSVANDYYKNMNKVKYVSPQFLDKKQ